MSVMENFDKEAFVEETREKISVIPRINKESIESMLKLVAHVDGDRLRKLVARINAIVEPAYISHILKSKTPCLSYPDEKIASCGNVTLGRVMAGDRELWDYRLENFELTENICGIGRAGSGKSTFFVHFIEQLHSQNIRFKMIDWKNEYSFLSEKYSDVYVIKWSQPKFNFLMDVPPSMPRRLYWNVILDTLAHSMGLYVSTPAHVLEVMEDIYQERNYVTFKDVEQFLRSQHESTNKRAEYSDVAVNRLFLLNESIGGNINEYNYMSINDFWNHNIVFQLAGLWHAVSSFYVNVLLLWQFYYRLFNGIQKDWQRATQKEFSSSFQMVCMDEASLTQYKGAEFGELNWFSQPPLTTFFSMARSTGLACCAFTQHESLLQDAFKSNVGTWLIGNIVNSEARKRLAATVSLDIDDASILGKLEKGYWIANTAGKTPKPFLMKTPFVEKPIVADEVVLGKSQELMKKLQSQQRQAKMFLDQVEKKSGRDKQVPLLPKNAWRLLEHVFEHPFSWQDKIRRALGFGSSTLYAMKDFLIDKGLITVSKFVVTEYEMNHYVLTEKALGILENLGKERKKIVFWKHLIGFPPGYEHRFHQYNLRRMHKMLGWEGRIEKILPNKRRADDFEELKSTGFKKIIEIEVSTLDIENKLKALEYCSELVLLFKEESIMQTAKSKMKKLTIPADKTVTLDTIPNYTKHLGGIIQRCKIKDQETAGKGPQTDLFSSITGVSEKPSGKGVENN